MEQLVVLQCKDGEESASEQLEEQGYIFEWVSPAEVADRLAYANEAYNRCVYHGGTAASVTEKPPFRSSRYNAYNPHPDKTKRIPHIIPEESLPVILPLDVADYKPVGKSPLADHPTFPYYTALDGEVYLRECDTLDTFMCSSFYYLRFADPNNTQQIIDPEIASKALPVDFYI